MADSDDEYDRKRRDKFRGERAADAAYSSRGSDRAIRAREDWQERDGWSRPRPRDYAGRVRDRGYSPSIEPAMKRPRTDYYGSGSDYFGGGGFASSAYHQAIHRREIAANQVGSGESGSGVHPMLSFKAFLATQDDNISDSEAIEKYNDYKLEFQRQQLNEFFVAHKDDEWFRIKYHPEDSTKRKEEQTSFIKKRVEVFMELSKEGRLFTSLDCIHTNALVKLLDTVVIKLEGGTEEEIVALDREFEEKVEPRLTDKEEMNEEKSPSDKEEAIKHNDKEGGEDGEVEEEEDKNEESKSAEEEQTKQELNGKDIVMKDNKDTDETLADDNKDKEEEDEGNEKQDESEKDKSKIESEEKMDEVGDKAQQGDKSKKEDRKLHDNEEKEAANPDNVQPKNKTIKENIKPAKDKKRKRSRSYSGSSSSSSTSGSGSSSDSDSDNEKVKGKEEDVYNQTKSEESSKDKTNGKNREEDKEADDDNDQIEDKEEDKANEKDDEDDKSKVVKIKEEDSDGNKKDKRPPPLHKTTSIFLRSLAPSITRQEVEAMCSRYSGFLRVALADPQPERRWQRRGWVTFRRDANIKEICWALNNARLRDCELGAIMNRDLSRRIRPVSGSAAHRSVVRTDIRVAARVAVHMDGKYDLWKEEDINANERKCIEEKFTPFGFVSHNPVLHNITDHLIEEASAEEDLLLGLEPTGGDDGGSADGTNVQVERDDALISVLDRIVLYLRIVHSIDYYNHCEYPNEDEMPSRCGILHARGPTPTARADVSHLMGAQAEQRMANFLPTDMLEGDKLPSDKKSDNEHKLITIAVKDVDAEIDKFVQANTRELAKDKWLCPLSGKKFKGPDFVRKHIFNKHAEKIEEVKKEVEFFNNYLKDSKRPAAADQHHPQQQQQQQQQAKRQDELPNNNNSGGSLGGYGGGHPPQQSYGGGYGGGGGYMGGRYGGGGYGGGYSRPHRGGYAHRARGGAAGGHTDYRPIIHYRDLDAPREPEEFI